ncbi:TadE/TadG family type IV pilus assembly protein [Paenibacillus sp. GCM10012306]|uniref:TadE/TadG family type IV pilus assembly protein n=1 Tax=Paenibacillus sp. GCM10012306 TaxID=3317342 RepID=UPI00361FE86C
MRLWLKRRRSNEKNEGSMVVEAAMVLPIFLLFVLFLIFIIQMSLYSTALQSTASDTVKVISTHIYPAALAAQKWDKDSGSETNPTGSDPGSKQADAHSPWGIPRLSLMEWGEDYANDLPPPLNEWALAAAEKGEGPLQKLQAEASQSVLDLAIKPLMKPYLASDMLEYDRIHVSNVIIPDLKKGTRPYFGVEVSYDLPMKVPFLNQNIVLEASAVERLWIGDTGEGRGGNGEEGGKEEPSIVILEKPDPGVVNKQGKVRAKIPPGTSANLTVIYKSGLSKAKYLGWKQADKDGYIEWEWKIGVNTTPGSWTLVIQTDDGQSIEVNFTVVSGKKGG